MSETELVCRGVEKFINGAWTVLDIDKDAVAKYRDEDYLEQLRLKLGEQRFRREILKDWTVASGEPFFLEVANDPDAYEYQLPHLLDAPMHVGLDFGQKFPAAIWLQYDEPNDRVFCLREWMPPVLTAAHTFRDVVLWLSGVKMMDKLIPEAQQWAQHLSEGPLPAPWFGVAPQIRYQWWTGHEAQITRAEVAADSTERSTAEIWEVDGITLAPHVVSVKARELAIRKLLLRKDDGWPGILFSKTGCPIILEGMRGGITFSPPTKANMMPDTAKRDGWYEHLADGLGYAVVSVAGTRRFGRTPSAPKKAPALQRASPYDRVEEPPKTPGFQFSGAFEAFKKRY